MNLHLPTGETDRVRERDGEKYTERERKRTNWFELIEARVRMERWLSG